MVPLGLIPAAPLVIASGRAEASIRQTGSQFLRDRHIVLAGGGTIEILRTMQAALIDLGCHVYCQADLTLLDDFDRPVDAVIHLELLELGARRIDLIRAMLDRANPDAPIINIALSHPLVTIAGLGLGGVEKINAYLVRRNIITWLTCPETQREFETFGLVQSLYQPLGVYPHFYLDPSGRWITERWVNNASPLAALDYKAEYKRGFVDIPEDVEALMRDKAVFLGVPEIDREDRVPVHTGAGVDQLRRTFPPRSKALYAHLLGYEVEPEKLIEFIQFHVSWIVNVPLQRRRLMAHDLVERFGDKITIVGDGWEKYVARSFPTSETLRLFYHHAACCLDFGSLQFDATCYPRTAEILKSDGLLVSGESSDRVIASNRFRTFEELANLVEASLDPERRPVMLDAQRAAIQSLDLAGILTRVLAPILPPTG
jgi:hypothetical protein